MATSMDARCCWSRKTKTSFESGGRWKPRRASGGMHAASALPPRRRSPRSRRSVARSLSRCGSTPYWIMLEHECTRAISKTRSRQNSRLAWYSDRERERGGGRKDTRFTWTILNSKIVFYRKRASSSEEREHAIERASLQHPRTLVFYFCPAAIGLDCLPASE